MNKPPKSRVKSLPQPQKHKRSKSLDKQFLICYNKNKNGEKGMKNEIIEYVEMKGIKASVKKVR